MGEHGQGKMETNTPNAPEFTIPTCLPKPQSFWISMKQAAKVFRVDHHIPKSSLSHPQVILKSSDPI